MAREPVADVAEAASDDHGSRTSRRGFLRAVGAGAAASAALPAVGAAQEEAVVSMGNNYFDPVGLHVEPGTTVRFELEAGTHSATAYEDRIPGAATRFDSGTLSSGSFEHTFEEPGTYDYFCRPHQSAGMVGRIVVGEPGGPAEASPIPHGAVPESDTIVDQGRVAADDADGGRHGGMMSSGPGMMGGDGPGWMMLIPIAVMTAVLGAAGAVGYWALGRIRSDRAREAPAMEILEAQYARGEIDDEEFQRRRERLERGE